MSKTPITKINGVDIYSVEQNEQILIPIRPICDALGIDVESQRDKIKNDEILSAVAVLSTATGSDGKKNENDFLPLRYIFGWLFTISPKRVSSSAYNTVLAYKRECYDALYNHFTNAWQRSARQARQEAELLRRKSELLDCIKFGKAEIKGIESQLAELSNERINPQPSLFD